MENYVLAYDIGTTGVKTCLFRIDRIITLIESASMGYGLTVLENGGVEQNVDEWWEAMCKTTKKIFSETDVKPEQIDGISFCSQMQGVVLVDKEGKALRPAMSYMDQQGQEGTERGHRLRSADRRREPVQIHSVFLLHPRGVLVGQGPHL